jgi:hypothetical protein
MRSRTNRWTRGAGGRFRAVEPYNLRRSPAADPLQIQRSCHISDNHKSQDSQVGELF